ncbi:MAG TPA: DUF5701 family protein [Humibacillus sp.]|nr:DUF5701 family protein [Humibacillus sp.]
MTVAQPTHPCLTPADVDAEVDRQIERLHHVGHVSHLGWSLAEAADQVELLRGPLRESAIGLPAATNERMPFVLVLPAVAPSHSITTQRLGARAGFLSGDTADIDDFQPLEALDVPTMPYAVVDVRRGEEHLGRTPDEAMVDFATQGRSPLTITEGLALLTAHPGALEKNHCFQTPGSRIGDRRVPGLWISKGAPKLGFCWAGNRHSWLGIASCARRVGS